MSPEQKFFIKESVMGAVANSGAENAAATVTFIKDATARLVVEIAKREWPQQWPTMLQVGNSTRHDRALVLYDPGPFVVLPGPLVQSVLWSVFGRYSHLPTTGGTSGNYMDFDLVGFPREYGITLIIMPCHL